MIMPLSSCLFRAAFGALAAAGAIGAPVASARAHEMLLKNTVPSMTVAGFASTEVIPNVATISLGVETERPTASEAASENARAVQAIVADVNAQGIEARDIRTASVTLDPVYDEVRDGAGQVTKRSLRGYVARNDLSVRVRQIAKAGALARQWIEKGANNIGGIAFDYEQKEVKYDALRAEAMRDALRKANSYVSALGLKLGRVLVIAPRPPSNGAPAPMRMSRMAQREGSLAMPIEPGIQTLQTEVEVTWELAP